MSKPTTSRELTPAEVESYNAHGGMICPECKASGVAVQCNGPEGGEAVYRDHWCDVCGATWTEWLKVVEVVVTELGGFYAKRGVVK